MLLALALTLIAIAGGTVATYLYEKELALPARLCQGACAGLAACGLSGFICASFLGLTSTAIALTALIASAPLALLINPARREAVASDLSDATKALRRFVYHPTRSALAYALFYLCVTILLWLVFDRAMIEDARGIATGVQNNYGDLPFHLSVITSFAYGSNFPPQDPTYAGAHFTYPFITDFISAIYLRLGASLSDSMFLENMVVALALVGLLQHWTRRLSRNLLASFLAPALVLLSGGLGWWQFFADSSAHPGGLFGLLGNLEQKYTIGPPGLRWGNALTTLLVPQRGILLGLALALIVFTLWWSALEETERAAERDAGRAQKKGARKGRSQHQARNSFAETFTEPQHGLFTLNFLRQSSARRMLAAGLIAGLLPLVHAHSFVVVMGLGGCVALLLGLKRWREWALFFAAALILAAPQLWWATRSSAVKAGTFFGWQLGWDRGTESILWFWLRNTGLFIPLLIVALVWRRRDREPLIHARWRLFYLPFTLCFIAPNLLLLAPWVWDNIKVLFYWWVASAPLVALLLADLWERKVLHWRALSVTFLIVLTLAGALDVFSVVARRVDLQKFDREAVAFAELVRARTPPRALILHAATHEAPVFLTGRQSFMGYPGHIWTHGLDFAPREMDIRRIYAGGPQAVQLLTKYGIEYVVVGPQERSDPALMVNDGFFMQYPPAVEYGAYRLYKVHR